MAILTTYMNELPDQRSVAPWALSSTAGEAVIRYGSLHLQEGALRRYLREESAVVATDTIDVRLSLNCFYAIADGQTITITDGVKVVLVKIDYDGINLDGEPKYQLKHSIFNHIRVYKDGEGSVSLYLNDDDTPIQTVPYSSLLPSTDKQVAFSISAATTDAKLAYTALHYLNYAINDVAPRYTGSRVDSDMEHIPSQQPTDAWGIVNGSGSAMAVDNGILRVNNGNFISMQREQGSLSPGSDVDLLFRVFVHNNVGEFLFNIFDGAKDVSIRVSKSSGLGYRLQVGAELPISIPEGFVYIRLLKTGTTDVKVFVEGGATPIFLIPYANLPASTENKMLMSFITGSASGEYVDVDFVNYGIDNIANESEYVPERDKFLTINAITGILEEHSEDSSRTKFQEIDVKEWKSAGDIRITSTYSDVVLEAGNSVGFRCNMGDPLSPLGEGDTIGSEARIGSVEDLHPVMYVMSAQDGIVRLPMIGSQQPLSIVHAIKLLTEFAEGTVKMYTAGATVQRGKALKFVGAQLVGVATSVNLDDAKVIGIAANDAQIGENVIIALPGASVPNVISGSAPNDSYFLDDQGGFTRTPPTASKSVVIRLGYSENSTNIFVDIGEPRRRF